MICRDFQKLTLDVIACCAFGIDTNSVKDPTSVFLQKCRGIFSTSEKMSFLGKLLLPLMCKFKSCITIAFCRNLIYQTTKLAN